MDNKSFIEEEDPSIEGGASGANGVGMRINVLPVSVNAMYRVVGGRNILSAAGRKFKERMRDELAAKAAEKKIDKVMGPVELSIHFTFKTRHRRDVDNYGKAVIDSLKNVMFEDDHHIVALHMYKQIGAADSILIHCQPAKPPQEDKGADVAV